MLALVKEKHGDGTLRLLEREIPKIAEDEVLIKVAYSGICGTDIHILHDQFTSYPPVIIGHEFSGTVTEVGGAVRDIRVGDRVVGEPHNLACGKCYLCRRGHIQNCMDKRSIGWGIDGSFTSYLKMPEKLLHKIPEGVSLSEAALAEPCAIVCHQMLERGRITPGDSVVIMGVGPIALIAAQLAKIAGAGKIILLGVTKDREYRLKVAEELQCFDEFIDVIREDSVARVREICPEGCDVVVEASGAPSAIKNAVKMLRKRGLFCAIGMTGAECVDFPWNEAMMKVIDLQFNMSSSYDGWRIALSLLESGKLRTAPMIATRPLREWEEAFSELESGLKMKYLLYPEEE